MTDQVPHDSTIIITIIGGAVVSYTTLLGWLGNRQVKRIDELEQEQKQNISRDEMSTQMTQLSTDIKSGFRDMHQRLDKHMEQHIDKQGGSGK